MNRPARICEDLRNLRTSCSAMPGLTAQSADSPGGGGGGGGDSLSGVSAMRLHSILPAGGGVWYCRCMQDKLPEHNDYIHSEEFLHRLMKRQLRLSIACAAAFMIVLFGLPLLNFFAPDFMAMRVGGFTLSWLILGVLFIPFVWVISAVFIKRSLAMENEEAEAAQAENRRRGVGQQD